MITNDNLFSASYNSVKTFLKNISGLDPRGRYKANWIHSSIPNINEKGFDGYPFIVLKVDVAEDNKSFDVVTSQKVFRVMISIYSDDSSHVDTISDSVVSNFKSNLSDFHSKEISSSPMAWNMDEHGKKISFRNIGIIARSRI
ncbi:MAG: hypothetical protein IMZ51_03995 [Chloroflexi bacterium]|nr:hypothetical protein [Chloroflexota bacterium]